MNNGEQFNFRRLKSLINLRDVRRWPNHKVLIEQSVAEHSFKVLVLFQYLGGTEYLAAAFHDAEEGELGDIGTPIKAQLSGFEKFEILRPVFIDPREKALGALADKLELVLHLHEQLVTVGKLPPKLNRIYKPELAAALKMASELGVKDKVKKILREVYA